MNAHPFSRLIELINFDQSIHELERSLDQAKQDIKAIRHRVGEQEHKILAAQTAVAQARKIVDRIELDNKELDQQARAKKKKMDHVANYKESQALQRELDQLNVNQHALEEILLKAWHSLETAEHAQQETIKICAQAQQELDQELSTREHASQQARESLDNLNKIRESKTVGVPQEWLDKYNAMRSFTSNPVVAVEGDSCGACYQEISKQELTRLRRGALLECQGCFRFLYNKDVLDNNSSFAVHGTSDESAIKAGSSMGQDVKNKGGK